jgi:hypothetical protein
MEITVDYLMQRIEQLENVYDGVMEKAGQIAGALQEAKFMLQKLNEKEPEKEQEKVREVRGNNPSA